METEYDGYVSDHHDRGDDFEDNRVHKPMNEEFNQHVDLIETELSQDIFYETVKKLVKKSERRRETRETVQKHKRKRSKFSSQPANEPNNNVDSKTYSRCSLPYLFTIIKKVLSCDQYIEILKKNGFDFMLDLDDCYVPRHFTQWVADHVNTEEEAIKIGSSSIPINLQSIKDTLGIRSDHIPVASDEEMGKATFLSLFGLDDIPSIKFFGDKIMNETLEDAVFLRCFVVVSLGSFLCSNSNTKLSTKYMGALVDPDQIKDIEWPKFIHQWLMMYIKKYLMEKKRGKRLTMTLGGCIYHLEAKERIAASFKIHMKNQDRDVCLRAQSLVRSIVEVVASANDESQDTVMIESSQDKQNSNDYAINSGTTEKIQTDDDNNEVQDEEEALNPRKRRRNEVKSYSKYEAHKPDCTTNVINTNFTKDFANLNFRETCAMQDDGKIEGVASERNFTVPIKTACLDHMLLEDDDGAAKSGDINMVCSKFKPSVYEYNSNNGIDQVQELRIGTRAEDRNSGFAGFKNIRYNEMKSIEEGTHGITENINVVLEPTHKDIDINLPNITFIDHYAKIQMIQGPNKRSEDIEEARKKYFFYEDGTPTFRIMEEYDDKGNPIEEPELWRPVGMDVNTYNKRIEEAK